MDGCGRRMVRSGELRQRSNRDQETVEETVFHHIRIKLVLKNSFVGMLQGLKAALLNGISNAAHSDNQIMLIWF